MDVRKIREGLTEIDGKVRVESGPVRKSEVATKELLSNDVTSDKYQVSQPRVDQKGKPLLDKDGKQRWSHIDALNNPIVLGKPMDYIDWKSKTLAWYVYKRGADTEITMTEGPQMGQVIKQPYWEKVGTYDTEAVALNQAKTLAAT